MLFFIDVVVSVHVHVELIAPQDKYLAIFPVRLFFLFVFLSPRTDLHVTLAQLVL